MISEISLSSTPHALCIPYPAQGHITPMLKLAKLLHFHGFHITFVNTEYNQRRLVNARGDGAVSDLSGFRFETIPDGLPPSENDDVTQDITALCISTMTNCLPYVRDLLAKLNSPDSGVPPVTVFIFDAAMTFSLDAADELGIPTVMLKTTSACGLLAYFHYHELIDRGLVPLKDENDFHNGYLNKRVDWVRGMKNMRLKDFPSFIRTINNNDPMLNFCLHEISRYTMPSSIILNTLEELESSVLEELSKIHSSIYTLGPFQLLIDQLPTSPLSTIGSSLWKEEPQCLQWLQGKEPNSVVYVNFGSITVMTNQQLVEFAWGLANSGFDFLWIIRQDLVLGQTRVLPQEFIDKTKDRSLIASWCPQEDVLKCPAIGGFLTHCGWNSILESICGGVPMLCWPFFSEQMTNCKYLCNEWGIGMEIDNDVKKENVEGLIRELMSGEQRKIMRRKALEWKESAIRATRPGGSSFMNLESLVKKMVHVNDSS